MKRYAITYECDHCGTEIENWTADFTEGNDIKISCWQLTQMSFDCPNCEASYGTGDLDVIEFSPPYDGFGEDDEEYA